MSAVKIVVAAAVALLCLVSSALATTPFVIGDTFDEYGTPTVVAGTPTLGPYNLKPCGSVACGSISVVGISNPPWNPNGNGHYLQLIPGANSIPNAGTGAYFAPGDPQGGWLHGFWFRYHGTPGTAFFYRLNNFIGQTFGGDTTALSLNTSGTITTDAGAGYTTTNTLTVNSWAFIEVCTQYGNSNATGSIAINVNSVNWLTKTSIQTGSTGYVGGANSFTFDNEFGAGPTFDFGPWYEENIGSAACPATSLFPAGTMYANTVFPNGNSLPLQFTPSTGSNFSNVNANPPGVNYNSNATVGNQDCYNYPVSGSQTGIVIGELSNSVEQDALGTRLTLPLFDNLTSVGGGAVANTGTLLNGTYSSMLDALLVSPFTGIAWTATELQHACVQLNN